MDASTTLQSTCTNCGSNDVQLARVRSAFFHDERLVVVEGIPAIVCRTCGDQYFDDSTVVVLDLFRGDGFPDEQAIGEITAPVFSFEERATRGS